MSNELAQLIQKYCRKGILVDTNILLLYFIGGFDTKLIGRFKRTLQFTPEDYSTLLVLLRRFENVVTTPHILAEVSNLSGQLGEPMKTSYFHFFAQNITFLEECYIESKEVAQIEEFVKFGLTDAAIMRLVRNKYLVLTDDFRLANYFQKKEIDVINFNNIRPLGWS